MFYLRRESFYQNSNKQIEQDIIAKSHQSNKIKCSPMWSLLHAIKKNNIPVFLCKNLQIEICYK